MNTYFARLYFGVTGCTGYELVHAESLAQAEKEAYELTVDWASSFGFEQDLNYFGELDSVGSGWDDEEESYEQEGFIDPLVELYDPETHDCYLN